MQEKLYLDLGNGYIKAKVPHQSPTIVRSLFAKILPGNPAQPYSATSPLIRKGTNIYHFGNTAIEYGSFSGIVSGDKAIDVCPAVYAGLGRLDGEYALTYSHPLPASVEANLRKQLIGRHFYDYNDCPVELEITELELLPEGEGTYRYAKQQQMLSPGFALIVDIGFGTAISRLYSAQGANIAGKNQVFQSGGVIALAKAISQDQRLKNRLQDMPDPQLIAEGLLDEYKYGYIGVNFKDIYEQQLPLWFGKFIRELLSQYQAYFAQLPQENIIFTGGGSTLIGDKVVKAKFRLMPEPQLANLMGMADE